MDIEKKLKEIYYAVRFELFNSLKIARKAISEQPSFISGKQVLDELLSSKQSNIFKQMLEGIQDDQLYQGSIKHGIDHNLRTSILAGYIAIKEKLSDQDFRILIAASMYHDIGRVADSEPNNMHGERSSKKINSLHLNQFSPEEIKILKAIIASHSQPDYAMQPIFKLHQLTDMNRAIKLANVLKDADALDRVRTLSGPDKNYLRTDTAKQLIPAAYEIYANINSIDGLPKSKWVGISEYIDFMLIRGGCNTQYEHIRSQFSQKSTYSAQQDFVNQLCRTGKRCFKNAISDKNRFENSVSSKSKIKIGIVEFDDIDSFCVDEHERKNMQIFLNEKSQSSQITAKISQDGKLIIDEGSLMHGITYDEAHLENVAQQGLIAPVFRTNKGDTKYDRGICVFRVEDKQLLSDYYRNYNTFRYNNNYPRAAFSRFYINGIYYRRNEEANWLPTDRTSMYSTPNQRLLFIINPTTSVQNLASTKLYKGSSSEYKRGYAIPIGIAPSQISGIMPSRELLTHPEKIAKLKEIFPDKYIATPDGELLHIPQNISVQHETFKSSKPQDTLEWIHTLTDGFKIRLGASEIHSVADGITIMSTKEHDEKTNEKE